MVVMALVTIQSWVSPVLDVVAFRKKGGDNSLLLSISFSNKDFFLLVKYFLIIEFLIFIKFTISVIRLICTSIIEILCVLFEHLPFFVLVGVYDDRSCHSPVLAVAVLLLTVERGGDGRALFCIPKAFLSITEIFPSWISLFVPHIFLVFSPLDF